MKLPLCTAFINKVTKSGVKGSADPTIVELQSVIARDAKQSFRPTELSVAEARFISRFQTIGRMWVATKDPGSIPWGLVDALTPSKVKLGSWTWGGIETSSNTRQIELLEL